MTDSNERTEVRLSLERIPAVSPSLAELLRICPLQAVLNRCQELRRFTLGSPKAWLGVVYHEVLEKLWARDRPDLNDEEWVNYLWDAAVERIRGSAAHHPLDCRFLNHENWPGYHLTRAIVLVRAREALSRNPRSRDTPAQSTETSATQGVVREQTMHAMNGQLRGQPDVILESEIWDYKSGTVLEESPNGVDRVKDGYVRQMRLYGHLVNENVGRRPRTGKLLPMQGNPVEIELAPEECEAEAEEAIELLNSLNSQAAKCESVHDLAMASEASCYWCSHKIHCEPFWASVSDEWWAERNNACVSGILLDLPTEIHSGRSHTLGISVSAGNVPPGAYTIGPFDRDVHADIHTHQAGDLVRLVGCYRKPDGTLTTTAWTVCYSESQWPEISCERSVTG